jgi:hypothetical protein
MVYLPQPMQPQSPVLLPQRASFMLRGGGAMIYLPETAPVPDRDTLREMAEAALVRDANGEHLREWTEIVAAYSQGKKQIVRYSRLFQLQHFWRVLHHRWGDRLKCKGERLQYAFAAFFLPDKDSTTVVETIRKDLQFLADRLDGPDWYRRVSALDSF